MTTLTHLERLEGDNVVEAGANMRWSEGPTPSLDARRSDADGAHLSSQTGDTAAAQAIVEAAGGKVVDILGMPLSYLSYNIKRDRLNPHFVVYADDARNWLPSEADSPTQFNLDR